MKIMLGTLSLAMLVGACATASPVPADKLARSQAAVKSAEEMNAGVEPRAALHLRLAREQLALGKRLMLDGENEKATMTLLRAESDGEAALDIARAEAVKADAQRTIQAIQAAMAQMQGGSGS